MSGATPMGVHRGRETFPFFIASGWVNSRIAGWVNFRLTLTVLKAQHIDPAPYLYRPAFVKDMKRRMGNALIKELVAKRGEERRKALLLHHPKAKQRLHQRSALELVLGAATMSAKVSQEAMDIFEEFQDKMRECEREKEEGQELV